MSNESNEEKFRNIQKQIKAAQSESDKARGALGQIQKTLADEFDCDSIAAARELLTALEAEALQLEQRYANALARFEAEFGDEL